MRVQNFGRHCTSCFARVVPVLLYVGDPRQPTRGCVFFFQAKGNDQGQGTMDDMRNCPPRVVFRTEFF